MMISSAIAAHYDQSYSSPEKSTSDASRLRATKELTPDEEREVKELEERDAEVRRHEQAHLAAAGQYARGGAHFEYETGPDGNHYAVGGEVNIDTSEVPNDPRATIEKANVIKRAALAPESPSGQDRRVAAEADAMRQKAQGELAEKIQEERGVSALKAQQYAREESTKGDAIDLAA